ncbi:MAG: TIR domain-containing protein [Deltaproteobacteria bacterium]|nr:TIR domain-containing protein [Deltaproteobacteria bacterium]
MPNKTDTKPTVFISWRRHEQAQPHVEWIRDRLARAFPDWSIAIDTYQRGGPKTFQEWMAENLEKSIVLLCIFGPGWREGEDPERPERQRGLADAEDFVRGELQSALDRKIPIITVLIPGGRRPHKEELPEELGRLADLIPIEIRGGLDFETDIDRLIAAIRESFPPPPPPDQPKVWLWILVAVAALVLVAAAAYLMRGGRGPGPPPLVTPSPVAADTPTHTLSPTGTATETRSPTVTVTPAPTQEEREPTVPTAPTAGEDSGTPQKPALRSDRATVEQAVAAVVTQPGYGGSMSSQNLPGVWTGLNEKLHGREIPPLIELLRQPTANDVPWKIVALLRISQRAVDDETTLKAILDALCERGLGAASQAVRAEALSAIRESSLPPERKARCLISGFKLGSGQGQIAAGLAPLLGVIDSLRVQEEATRAMIGLLPAVEETELAELLRALSTVSPPTMRSDVGNAMVKLMKTRVTGSFGSNLGAALEKLDFREAIPALREKLKMADPAEFQWVANLLVKWGDRDAGEVIKKAIDRIRYVGNYQVLGLVSSLVALEGDRCASYVADVLRKETPYIQNALIKGPVKEMRAAPVIEAVRRVRDTTSDKDVKSTADAYLATVQ